MRLNQFIVALILLTTTVFQGNAQEERLLQGMVTTFDSLPLIGAEIKVKSSKEVITTDTLGRFRTFVEPEDKLRVSARGFYPQNVKLDEKIKLVLINLKLKPTPKAKEYAIGYGYVKDAEKLNSLAQLTEDDVDFSQYSNIYELIRGRFAGVVVQPNGDIIIRGVNSLNLSSAALIIIDGIPADNSVLQSISPINVKSINVIKDGSAAIYGARGANGVVVIETKKGDD